jgi:hypothetical protein
VRSAFFAYANNYLIDVKCGIIMDVEASRAIRQAEVGASQTMIERTEASFAIRPEWLVADTAYGSAANLNWLVNEKQIAPYVRQARLGRYDLVVMGVGRPAGETLYFGKIAGAVLENSQHSILFVSS